MTDLQHSLPACLPHPRLNYRNYFCTSSNCQFFAIFRTFIRRNAVFLTTIFAGAFAFELTYDTASNKIWDSINAGRQWKDIKYKYIQQAEEDDE
ncbi:hypothetical protein N7495_003960 [Penicillium taxi]|uniref:uncharacterized protein n=1 Tax=Penicillium taxi TaxID=168475 RepID=UPI00254553D5|nr:uncharacterized protein N7495_003960 [Penicillium taxi]KAJ5899216.1 hypothetical protein N7495_003960 [Penicillium taxi]